MNRIKTERTIHDNKAVVKLLFDYDKQVVTCMRTIQDVLWSRTMHCWYIAVFNRDYILAKKLSATYQGQFVNAIKLFYEKIPGKKIIIEQLECPRKEKPLLYIFSKDDIAQIISARRNIKHKIMLSLIYHFGLRRSEVLNMRITNIDSKQQIINIRHAKGDKDRIAPLSDKILQLLREYFKQYRPVEWLFEGQIAGTQHTETSLNKIFLQVKNKVGVKMPCHAAYATHLLEGEQTFGLFKHY